MPTGFTQGDVFFNPESIPAPFTSTPLEETTPEPPHPLLNSKIAKNPPGAGVFKSPPKLVPPPPPVIPGQASLQFSSQKPPTPPPPRLVPPPPPVTVPVSPPPAPKTQPPETPPKDEASPYQYPEIEKNEPDPDLEPDSEPAIENPNENQPQSPGPQPPGPAGTRAGSKTTMPDKAPHHLGQRFKQSKGIIELPLALAEPDFCGSLCVPVEEGHSVILILLAKQIETGPNGIKITTEGFRLEGKDAEISASLQTEVERMTNVAAKLQGDIASNGSLIDQVISFLSGANLKFLAPRAPIEAVRGTRGNIIGYFQGESFLQFVVSVALISDGPVTHYLDLPFPAILTGGVETYLLPSTADVSDFVRYLTAKNSVGWRGQKTRTVRHRLIAKQNTLGRTLTWGGSAVIAYAFMAGLLGAFFPESALSLSLLAPAILGAVLAGTAQLWRKAKRDMTALNLALANRTSWRLVNFARDQVDRTVAQLQGAYKRQFIGEMCPQDALDTITKLGKTPTPELVQDPQLHEEVTAAACHAFGPSSGADGQLLMGALRQAIAEVKQKRIGGSAKVVIAVTKARVQAIIMKVGGVSSKEMDSSVPLDVLFSASLARAKFPVPTSISVPLLDLERDILSEVPATRDCMTKAIAAAMALVEHTGHFWAKGKIDHVKEIPYPKTSVPVVGEDFDNAFG